MVYVIPSIADLFRQMRIELPALTQWVMTFSENLSTHFTIFIIVVFALIYGAHTAIRKSYRVRYQFHKLLLKLPVSKVLIKSSVLAFITEYLSLLISSGINIVDSLEVIERSTKNEVYREKINQIRKGVSRGNSLSDEIRFHQAFPGFVIRMISVGEQSGSLDQQLRYLAEEYRQRFDHVVASISEIIKPLVMLIAGGLFILMIVALFLPIYQLIGQVQ
jgi:general secretion pathway protein F/type IV pilus assembly protein PilC